MQLKSCKKTYNLETQRAAPLEETLARIEPKVPAAGITRVADITNLDRIGFLYPPDCRSGSNHRVQR
jgi:ribosomal protein S12 methylthiotransferase accessory factor YcaO